MTICGVNPCTQLYDLPYSPLQLVVMVRREAPMSVLSQDVGVAKKHAAAARPNGPVRGVADKLRDGAIPDQTIWKLLVDCAAVDGDPVLLVGESGERLAASDIVARAHTAAVTLAGQGISPGTVVAWRAPIGVDAVVLMFALARLNAVQAPISMTATPERAAGIAHAAEADVVLIPTQRSRRGADTTTAAALGTVARTIPVGPEMYGGAQRNGLLRQYEPRPNAPQWIFASGDTPGAPCGARHSDSSLLAAVHGLTAGGGLGGAPGDVGAVMLGPTDVRGLVYLLAMMKNELAAMMLDESDPSYAVGVMRQVGATVAVGRAGMCDALIAMQRALPKRSVLLPRLQLLRSTGSPCSAETVRAGERDLGVRLVRDYGTTEAPLIGMAGPFDTKDQLLYTAGSPAVGVRVRIVENGVRRPTNAAGTIEVFGAGISCSDTDPASQAAWFTDDRWLSTGDRGRLLGDGHLEVFGNDDRMACLPNGAGKNGRWSR